MFEIAVGITSVIVVLFVIGITLYILNLQEHLNKAVKENAKCNAYDMKKCTSPSMCPSPSITKTKTGAPARPPKAFDPDDDMSILCPRNGGEGCPLKATARVQKSIYAPAPAPAPVPVPVYAPARAPPPAYVGAHVGAHATAPTTVEQEQDEDVFWGDEPDEDDIEDYEDYDASHNFYKINN